MTKPLTDAQCGHIVAMFQLGYGFEDIGVRSHSVSEQDARQFMEEARSTGAVKDIFPRWRLPRQFSHGQAGQ